MTEKFIKDICHKCFTPHIGNCPDCAGFGVIKNNSFLSVTEAKAIHEYHGQEAVMASKLVNPCPTCGATVWGYLGENND